MLKSVFLWALLGAVITVAALIFFLPNPITLTAGAAATQTTEAGATQTQDLQAQNPDAVLENSFALTNVQLFDGDDFRDNIDIIIEDGRITSIGSDLSLPPALPVIEGSGKTLIPGLVDAHTHSWNTALAEALQFGVTTNIDMFSSSEILAGAGPARDNNQPTREAALYSAGMLATAPDGHGTQYGLKVETLTGPDQAEAWVDKRLAEGSDFIKIVYHPYAPYRPSIDRDTAKAIIDAGHARGVLVVAHIVSQRGAHDLIEDGIDGLVHIFADTDVTPEFVSLALEKNIFIIPTLAVLGSIDGKNITAGLLEDPDLAPYMSRNQRQSLGQTFPGGLAGFSYDIAIKNIRALHQGGVTILAGSDAPNPGTAHGVSVHHEMALLVTAGLSPVDALKAATSGPGDRFAIKAGRIAEGLKADMILLAASPQTDISATRNITAVYRNGYAIERTIVKEDAATALTSPDLGTFEDSLTTAQGFVWATTTDAIAGGVSEAMVTRTQDGANASTGALKVEAEVKAGFPFPWAGAFLMISQDFSTGKSLDGFDQISFDVRGTPGTYRMMIFNAGSQGIPPTRTFAITDDWQKISLKLSDFPGLSKDAVAAIAIVAGPQIGKTTFDIDNVRLD